MTSTFPSNNSLLWLMLGLTLGALPHFIFQPLWVSIIFLAMIGWRCMNSWRGWPLPTKRFGKLKLLQLTIAGITFLLLLFSYGNLIGRDAGVGLLTVMLGLKVTEIRSHRDYYVSCFLGFFLVVTNFFYSQSIATAALMFVVVTIMTGCLISLNVPNKSFNNRLKFKLASQMLLQAIPLMIVLFVFFPRIAGPLWGIPDDAYNAKTGIDNSMTLGKISQLITSNEVAFRVEFEDKIPKQADLYWRGPILWQTNGTTWTELEADKQVAMQPQISHSGTAYRYTTTLEAHNNKWLFALDFPSETPTLIKSHFTQDGQLRSDETIKQRQQYQLSSTPKFQFNAHDEPYLQHALQLPKNKHQRTKQLAQKWRSQTDSPQQLIQLALSHFNQQDFYYTLSPPQLAGDTIDSFLFESRRGFCEHYAASFTILMRAAGVPTRIVTGYQGGEINPIDNFLVVRQRDAHAWTEVWLKGQGWLRIDPTAAVSKDRIEQGMSTIMPLTMRAPLLISQSQKLAELWLKMRNNLDAIDNKWNQWILAYGPKLQKEFLSKLGLPSPNWQNMALWLGTSLSLVLLLISAILFYHRKHPDPIFKLYQQFCNKAARIGITRKDHEGPLDFANRLKHHYPQQYDDIDQISQLYINLHYGKQSASIDELRYAIKQFRFKKL
ncbi:MAG: DUF3488 domain-containing protein [Methylococcaceae bacterium]|nr:DUF3488 domain-containing protein [Methylococcaceae bacterium]